jgi:hypothetical protein
LLDCLHRFAARTDRLLGDSDGFAAAIADTRLGLEVSVINTLAHRLTRILQARDPLRERVHLAAPVVAAFTLLGVLRGGSSRLGRRVRAAAHRPRGA